MRAYTGRGDRGKTSLLFGGRAGKDNPRIECLGDLDELNSFLGLSKAGLKSHALKNLLNNLQKDIYFICSEIAADAKNLKQLKRRFAKERLFRLEREINKLAAKVKLKNYCFFIPGENFSSATLDVCRTICRRAERRVVSLNRKAKIKNPSILAYINRLSSFLFVLARLLEKTHKIS